ncbi:hypothetical protein ACEPAG_1982 [Sanghuangporus baumii]
MDRSSLICFFAASPRSGCPTMDYDNELFKQVLVELKSYLPVMLPVLLVYLIEIRAHLKVWHAVRQLPHLEKEPVQDDFEAGSITSSKQVLKIRAKRKAVQSIARQQWIFKFVFVFILAAIVLFDQFVALSGWLNRAKKDEGFTGYNGSINDFDVEAESQSGYGYRWYYDSMLGQIDWAKSYYFMTLILPSFFLLGRTLSLLGVRDRVVLRNTNGYPFIKIVAPTDIDQSVARRRAQRNAVVVLTSALLASGALWLQNPICTVILFASIVHFIISDIVVGTAFYLRQYIIWSIYLLVNYAVFIWLLVSSPTLLSHSVRLLHVKSHEDGTAWNWSGLIVTALTSPISFHLISTCYRMDNAFANPEELLVGGPNIVASKDTKTGAELIGMRIPYCSRRYCNSLAFPSSSSSSHSSSSEGSCCRLRRRPRWAKTYFRICLLSWLLAYALTAYLKVKGYIATDAELAGLYVSFFFPPIASVAIILRSVAKGREEVKKVWAYKEDWINAGKELDAVQSSGSAVAGFENEGREEGKVLLSEERHTEMEKAEE